MRIIHNIIEINKIPYLYLLIPHHMCNNVLWFFFLLLVLFNQLCLYFFTIANLPLMEFMFTLILVNCCMEFELNHQRLGRHYQEDFLLFGNLNSQYSHYQAFRHFLSDPCRFNVFIYYFN